MRKEEIAEFNACLRAAADLYGRPALTQESVKIFAMLLKDFDFVQIKKALTKHMQTSPYMPKPADIITILNGAQEDKAAAAWGLVLKAVARYGRTDSVKFTTPAIHYAIDQMGGWRFLCETLTNDNLPFKQKEFERYYKIGDGIASWTEGAGKTRVPAYFKGEHECHNGTAYPEYRVKIWEVESGKPVDAPALTAGKEANAEKDKAAAIVKEVFNRVKIRNRV